MKPFWAKLCQILSHKTNQAIVKTGCQRSFSTERFLLSIVFAARGFSWRCIGLDVASPQSCVAWRFWLGEPSNKGGRGQRLREEIAKPPSYTGYRRPKNLYTRASQPLGSPSLHFASNRIFRDVTELWTVPARYQALLLHLPNANFKMAAKSQRIDKVSNLYSIVII